MPDGAHFVHIMDVLPFADNSRDFLCRLECYEDLTPPIREMIHGLLLPMSTVEHWFKLAPKSRRLFLSRQLTVPASEAIVASTTPRLPHRDVAPTSSASAQPSAVAMGGNVDVR